MMYLQSIETATHRSPLPVVSMSCLRYRHLVRVPETNRLILNKLPGLLYPPRRAIFESCVAYVPYGWLDAMLS